MRDLSEDVRIYVRMYSTPHTLEVDIRKDQMPHGWGQSYRSNPHPYPHLALVGGGGA